MFEFELKHLAAVIIGLGVALRPYLLNRFKGNNALGNTLYFIIVIALVTPMYMYKFTFSSLDDNTAKQLVDKILTFDPFSHYKRPSNIAWKAYDEEKSLYNIQADLFNGQNAYRLFLQPECHFFKGCEVALDRIMLLPKEHADYDINTLTAQRFEKRVCSDVLVESILKEDRLPYAIKLLFQNMKTKTDSTASYKIRSISLSDYKETKLPYSATVDSNITLKNSCEAKFKLEGDFSLIYGKDKREYAAPLFKTLFDDVSNQGQSFSISSSVTYGIYLTPNKEITILAQPFNVARFQKFRKSSAASQQPAANENIQKKFANAEIIRKDNNIQDLTKDKHAKIQDNVSIDHLTLSDRASLLARERSTVRSIYLFDDAKLFTQKAPSFTDLHLFDQSKADIDGGHISNLFLYGSNELTIHKAEISAGAFSSPKLSFSGGAIFFTDASKIILDVKDTVYNKGRLSGKWHDGTPFSFHLVVVDGKTNVQKQTKRSNLFISGMSIPAGQANRQGC